MRRADQLRRRKAADGEVGTRQFEWQATPVATRTTWEPRARRNEPRAYRVRSIPLNERGVEVQMPVFSLSLSPRGAATTLAFLAGFALLFLLTTRMFHAGMPAVQGVHYLAVDSVVDASGVLGANLFQLSPDGLSRSLPKRMPGIKQASLSMAWNGDLAIDVEERAPILLWQQNGGQYWADAEGVIFPAAGPLDGLVQVDVTENGPALTLDGQPNIPPNVVAGALQLTVALPPGSRIVYDKQHGLGMQDANGWPVFFGDPGDVSAKLTVYNGLVNNLMARGIRPSSVNVADIRQPFYRRTEAKKAEG
jgi:cell division septal protein FtsQ